MLRLELLQPAQRPWVLLKDVRLALDGGEIPQAQLVKLQQALAPILRQAGARIAQGLAREPEDHSTAVRQRDKNIGYNAVTAEYVDMFKAGVIDPAKVVKNALRNAASIAGLMLTTQVLVTRTDDVSGGKPKAAVEGAVK